MKINDEIFIVGKYIKKTKDGAVWEFEGVFSSKDKAEAACVDRNYFVGPCLFNRIPSDCEWPGCYYPKAEAA